MTGWPGGFDVRSDPAFHERIAPYIARKLSDLKTLDTRRAAWVAENLPPDYAMTYLFHDHALRVAADMRDTVLHMELPAQIAENLYQAMLLHDIGKLDLPLHLWDMVEKPEDDIKRARRRHTELGAASLRKDLPFPHPFLDLAEDIILNHHEQMNGKGYRGIPGKDLSPPVRLACIVESFDGYRTPRPHFGDRDVTDAGVIKRMREEKGADLYDLELLEKFAEMKKQQYNGSLEEN